MTSTLRRIRPFSIAALGIWVVTWSISTAWAQQSTDVDGIIVRYRTPQVGAALDTRVAAIQDVASRHGVLARYGRSGALGVHVMKLDRSLPVSEAESLAEDIEASDPSVEYAEPDRVMYPALVPNDTRYNEQWHYFEATGGIDLPSAWDLSTGTGVRVAVIDTGYRPHVDLAANILAGYDFISDIGRANDGDGRDADARDPGDACSPYASTWHGTHVAGTIAALTNNGIGVAGVAFNSRIVPVRVLGVCGGLVSDIADGIIWASGGAVPGVPTNANPARVLNLSLGGSGGCSATYQNAINAARSRNSVVVVAAGNNNQDAVNFQPANCAGVITVAATNRSGAKASYSNFGATVEIAAPGGEQSPLGNGVLSTFNTGTTVPGADSYQFDVGTSMATPHVSGVVALMLARNGALTPDQVLQVLQSTARAFPGPCSQCGAGIADAFAALSGGSVIVDTRSMTVGLCSAFGGYVVYYGYAVASAYCPAIGSLTPATLSTGQFVPSLVHIGTIGADANTVNISGFSSDPGASWLVSVTTGAGTLASSTASYSYSSGTATWVWSNMANVYVAGQVVIRHH